MGEEVSGAIVGSIFEALKAVSTEEAVADEEEEVNAESGSAGCGGGYGHR